MKDNVDKFACADMLVLRYDARCAGEVKGERQPSEIGQKAVNIFVRIGPGIILFGNPQKQYNPHIRPAAEVCLLKFNLSLPQDHLLLLEIL